MPLSPSDVDDRKFSLVPKTSQREGYDVGEVDSFLDEVRDSLVDLYAQHDELARQLEVARAPGSDATEAIEGDSPAPAEPVPAQAAPAPAGPAPSSSGGEQAALRLLQHAQRTADAAIADAEQEAARLREGAASEASRVQEEAAQAASTQAEDLERQRVEAVGQIEADRRALVGDVGALREFDERSRGRLRDLLTAQLAELDARPPLDALPRGLDQAPPSAGSPGDPLLTGSMPAGPLPTEPADGGEPGGGAPVPDRPVGGSTPFGGGPFGALAPGGPSS